MVLLGLASGVEDAVGVIKGIVRYAMDCGRWECKYVFSGMPYNFVLLPSSAH